MSEEEKPTVMVSGGFDPVHAGHIRMIREAAQYGDVIIVANSDAWLYRKKGFVFMEYDRRIEILNAIKGVIKVDSVDDTDDTVCEAIRRIQPTYFANGGGRGDKNTPEVDVCNELNIKLLWSIGGNEKLGNYHKLEKKTRDFEIPPPRGLPKSSSR
mgnify:CR=1 FL=1|tara:strand:+ start:13579 stop:14046 length:468 start_codon:yes stop_codon:yes gene_type:complete